MNKALQQELDNLWTTKDLCQVFDKTSMTILHWRKTKGLPTVVIPGSRRPTIRFSPRDVIAWADKHEIEYTLPNAVQ